MTPLRQRMLDDMRLAGFAQRTRDVYIQAVRHRDQIRLVREHLSHEPAHP